MGHMVDLPYTPVCYAVGHPLLPRGSPPTFYGGADKVASGRDQARALAATVGYFKRTL
jgi:hypothetical protein